MSVRFKDKFLYPLKDSKRYGEGYGYVLTVEGAEGTWMADCWVVNEHGDKHPGYSECPIPVLVDQVVIEEGVASATYHGDGMSSLMGDWLS